MNPGETVEYYLYDYLGGVDAVLDEEGNVAERRDYLPYGGERTSEGGNDERHGFTGKEKPLSSALVDPQHKKEKKYKKPLLYVFTFLLSIISYHLQWVRIYDQWVGGAKTWKTFADPGSDCDYFFMRPFKYTGGSNT